MTCERFTYIYRIGAVYRNPIILFKLNLCFFCSIYEVTNLVSNFQIWKHYIIMLITFKRNLLIITEYLQFVVASKKKLAKL